MRILFFGINYWPERTGIAAYNTAECEYLAGLGHDVCIYTGFPYYPEWRKPPEYRRRILASELHNGVKILRSYLYVPARVTSLKRVIHEASFIASALLRAMAARKPEVIITVSPPLGLAMPAILLGRIWRVPYVFHVQDLQPDAAVELGMLRRGRLTRVLYGLESLAYRKAALVSTITESMRATIVSKGISAEKVEVLANWADPSLFEVGRTGRGEKFRRAFGLEGKFLVVHSGNMGVKQGLDVILDAAAGSSSHPDITYLLVGDGAVRPGLEKRAASFALSNLRFLPLQPGEMFRDMMAAADVCLITQQRRVADIVFPSKTLTILAAGCPVIASLNSGSEVARAINRAGAGPVVEPENPQALLEAVLELKSNPERRIEMGERGRAYAHQNWSRERILSAMEAKLAQLVRRGKLAPTGLTPDRVTPQ